MKVSDLWERLNLARIHSADVSPCSFVVMHKIGSYAEANGS